MNKTTLKYAPHALAMLVCALLGYRAEPQSTPAFLLVMAEMVYMLNVTLRGRLPFKIAHALLFVVPFGSIGAFYVVQMLTAGPLRILLLPLMLLAVGLKLETLRRSLAHDNASPPALTA